MKELNLKNDIVFKAFFAKKGNEKFLKSFLESILNVEIKKIEIVGEANLLQLSKTDKLGRLDIKATVDDEKIINVEMQVEKDKDMDKRSVFYGCSMIREQIGKGGEYTDIKPVVQINILDFIHFEDIPEYCTKTKTVSEGRRDYEIETYLQYIYIELPKFRKKNKEIANELECWLALIDNDNKNGGKLLEMAEKKSKVIKEAKEELREILSENVLKEINWYIQTAEWDEASRLRNAEDRGKEEGLREGKIEGMREGIKQISTEYIKEMIKLGIDKETIKKITKLDEKEIEKMMVKE